MDEIAIIIPSRLGAKRLPNKPLKLINKKEMILHVYESAKKAKIGEVYVATPDKKIAETIKAHGGKVEKTKHVHETGTDRVFELFSKKLDYKPKIIINLQGDMPNIDPQAIKSLAEHMKKKSCDIATLASNVKDESELKDVNVVKVITRDKLNTGFFSRAVDFVRELKEPVEEKVYHHVGIYAFTNKALIRYVELERTESELEKKLEQLRALENKMTIDVGFINDSPLSVDTEDDLNEVRKLME